MKNIIFSTTRQWNPGDEIILKGVINLLKGLGLKFNPLIFNRNPDIRSLCTMPLYKNKAELKDGDWRYIKTAMMENSVKSWTKYTNIDAIVFAGTPEWQGRRNRELYINAIKHHIPVFLIGIDSAYWEWDYLVESVIKNAKFISVRNKEIRESFWKHGISIECITCPAILACDTEKIINEVQCIGLIYRGYEGDVTAWNGWDVKKYNSQNKIYNNIILKYKEKYKIIIICHYIDEIYVAQKDFPGIEIRYSYDCLDYFEIYKECDFVIGSRVHGIGIAASMGIPSIPVKYDIRGGTMDGFYPDDMVFEPLEDADSLQPYLSHIKELNRRLILHKKGVEKKYQKALEGKLDFEKVNYNYHLIQLEDISFQKEEEKLCELDNVIYSKMIPRYIEMVLEHINKMIEGKRIIIKGGGEHTRIWMRYLTDKTDIVCIVDNNVTVFDEYKVVKNNEVCKINFDYILISSMQFEREMINEMKEIGVSDKIVSLYRIMADNFILLDREFYAYLD